MTIDEAIKVCEDNATKIGGNPQSDYHAACYKQVAEWLTELKELREENKVLMQECDRLIKEKGELLNKVSGGDVLRICQLEEQLKKAKRLLKAAVEDINGAEACDTCEYYTVIYNDMCKKNDCYKWRYADEALKLIGGSENG